jgi:hypothetical protein
MRIILGAGENTPDEPSSWHKDILGAFCLGLIPFPSFVELPTFPPGINSRKKARSLLCDARLVIWFYMIHNI